MDSHPGMDDHTTFILCDLTMAHTTYDRDPSI